MQNLLLVSDTVRAHVGGPNFFFWGGTLEPRLLWIGEWLTPRNTLLCYTPNFVALGQTVWA